MTCKLTIKPWITDYLYIQSLLVFNADDQSQSSELLQNHTSSLHEVFECKSTSWSVRCLEGWSHWPPEFNPWNSYGERREQTPRSRARVRRHPLLYARAHRGTYTKELNVKLLNVRFMPTKFYCKGQYSSMGEQILITLKDLGSISQSHTHTHTKSHCGQF